MRDDKVLGSTVRIDLTTHDSTGALVAPSSAFAASDFRIYKDGSAAEKATTNGITVTSPFDSIVGKHLIEIDTGNSTGDVGFWAAGSEYRVEINSAKTISSINQSGVVVGRFTLVAAGVLRPSVDGRTIAVSATTGKVTAEAVALDSATQTQITAIETFATRITTGIVQDGAVWQFTTNMLELGPGGGSSTVTVLPATGIVANRSAGITLTPVVGETISQAITVYQSDGTTAVDLSSKSLKVIFETMNGTDVAVVNTADITISGTDDNVVTFAYPSAVTASERTLRFAIRDAAAPLTMYLQGVCSVVSAPKVDA